MQITSLSIGGTACGGLFGCTLVGRLATRGTGAGWEANPSNHTDARLPAPPSLLCNSPGRALFERATHLQLPPKKMKFLFKRYLEYEKKEGTAATVEHVKRRAMEFVQAVGGGGA